MPSTEVITPFLIQRARPSGVMVLSAARASPRNCSQRLNDSFQRGWTSPSAHRHWVMSCVARISVQHANDIASPYPFPFAILTMSSTFICGAADIDVGGSTVFLPAWLHSSKGKACGHHSVGRITVASQNRVPDALQVRGSGVSSANDLTKSPLAHGQRKKKAKRIGERVE